ncbi:MAG TPA: dihydrofolate reductase family protein [Acidimicrobiales bacterium]|nr:dihydrofolate reductase family protein [Acidimicrobiales bacterium]
MRRLVVSAFVTLDGVMQAPGGPEEDPTGGFTQGGWSVNYWDDVMAATMTESLASPFDLLLGRRTYEIFAAHWPHVDEQERAQRGGTPSDVDNPVANVLNTARKYVASRTLEAVEWNNSVLLGGDAAEAVRALKDADGPELMVQGSSDLIQTLLEHDLVDELRIWTFPVVVGPGKRLFGRGTVPGGMELVDVKTSTTGVLMATYRRAGAVPLGSFAFEDPTDEEVARRRRLAGEGSA